MKILDSVYTFTLENGKTIKKGKGREWVMQKKESQRRQGKEVRHDSKYTARRRTGQMKF